MKKILKWVAIVVGAIIGLIVVAVAAVYVISELRIGKERRRRFESAAARGRGSPSRDRRGHHRRAPRRGKGRC